MISGFDMYFMAGKPRGRDEMMVVGLTKILLHDETCPAIWRGGGNIGSGLQCPRILLAINGPFNRTSNNLRHCLTENAHIELR
jgi:hypothetical protein